jgi:hypothetical protein
VTSTPSLPLRILLGIVAALWAVLVPGRATVLAEQPLQWPQWLRPARPTLPQPELLAVRLPAES